MLTIAGLVTLCLGVWGFFEVALDLGTDRRSGHMSTSSTRFGDFMWLCATTCLVATALHSLVSRWVMQ